MNREQAHRKYHNLNPLKGFPANNALFYECSRCGDVLPSASKTGLRCTCGNIAIDPSGIGITAQDPKKVRLFSLTSAAKVDRSKVVHNLKQLADRGYQQRVWVGPSKTEMSSFEEAVCGLFDDSGLGKALDKRETVFTEEIDTLLRELNTAIQKVDSSSGPVGILDDPHMSIVRKWAADLVRRIEADK